MTRVTIEKILTKLSAIEKKVDMVLSEQRNLSAKVDQIKSEPDDVALLEVNIIIILSIYGLIYLY